MPFCSTHLSLLSLLLIKQEKIYIGNFLVYFRTNELALLPNQHLHLKPFGLGGHTWFCCLELTLHGSPPQRVFWVYKKSYQLWLCKTYCQKELRTRDPALYYQSSSLVRLDMCPNTGSSVGPTSSRLYICFVFTLSTGQEPFPAPRGFFIQT